MTANRVILCLVLAASGVVLQSCVGQGGRPPDTNHVASGDYIEFVSPGSYHYLISKGVAKITLPEPSENAEPSGKDVTVVLPCFPAEAARLIAVVEAAYGPGQAQVLGTKKVIRRPHRPREPDSMRWQVGGNLRNMSLGYIDYPDPGWHLRQWIRGELDQVTQVALARAILWREKAEAISQAGNQQAACEAYRTSCTHLAEWVNARAMRSSSSPTEHYEAELRMAEPMFAYQSGDYSGALEGFRQMWRRLGEKAVRWSKVGEDIVVQNEDSPGKRVAPN